MKLRAGEINIARDTCMLHRGILASKADIILTNERLLINPIGMLDKITGAQSLEIDIDNIDMIDVRGLESMLYIEAHGKFIKLSGAGALRMKDPIEAQRTRFSTGTSNIPIRHVDPILLQGSIQIFILRHLSTNGEVFLTARSIRLISKGFIENLIFRPIKIEEEISNIEDLDYQRLDRILKIHFANNTTISLTGELANRLYVLLSSMREGTAEGVSPLLSGINVTLYQGMLAPAQVGQLILTYERLLFSPGSHIDSLVGAQNFSLLLSDINRLEVRGWPEKRLHIYYKGSNISFDIESPALRLTDLKDFIINQKPSNAFEDLRTQIDMAQAIHFCAQHNIDAQEELPIFIERSMEVFNKLAVRFGWLLLTQKNLYFIPDEQSDLWISDIQNITQIRLRKSDIPHLSISVKATRHHFYIKGNKQEDIDFLWEKINEIKPPSFLVAERNNQPLERLLGKFDIILFRKDGCLFLDVNDVELKIIETLDHQKLRIFMPKIESHKLEQGMPLDIELAKDGGRYKMSTILTEMFLTYPDPMGRYYISLETPDDIIFYNQRGDFRISLFREVIYQVFHIIQFDQSAVRSSGLILEDIWNNIGQGHAQVNDISMGGCSLTLPYNLKTHAPSQLVADPIPDDYEGEPEDYVPTYQVIFDPEKKATVSIDNMRIQVSVPLSKSKPRLNLRIVRIQPVIVKDGNIHYQYGLEFIDLDKKTVNELNKEILLLEREFLRKRKKDN